MYAGVQDMVARFGDLEVLQLSDRQQQGVINTAVVETALADATAEIDAYLGRFKQPFKETPPILTRLCCDIARYRLCAASGVLITEEIRNRYQIDVLNLLKALAKGDVQLGADSAGKEAESSDTGIVFARPKNKVFYRDYSN